MENTKVNRYGYREFDESQLGLLGKHRFRAFKGKFEADTHTIIGYRLVMDYVIVTVWRPAYKDEIEVRTLQKLLTGVVNAEEISEEFGREMKLAEKFAEEFGEEAV